MTSTAAVQMPHYLKCLVC